MGVKKARRRHAGDVLVGHEHAAALGERRHHTRQLGVARRGVPQAHRPMGAGQAQADHPFAILGHVRFGPRIGKRIADAIAHHRAHRFEVGGAHDDVRRGARLDEQAEEIVAAPRRVEQHHRVRLEVLHAYRRQARQRVIFADHHIGRQLRQGLEVDVRAGHQVVGQGDIQFTAAQFFQQFLVVAFGLGQPHAGERAAKTKHQLGGDHRRQRLQAPDPQRPAHGVQGLRGDGVEVAHLFQNLLGLLHHQAPHGGQGNTLGVVADKQLDTQFGFHMGDGRRDRRR